MRCYMNREHRKAESDKNKRQDLDYIRDRVGVDIFCDLEDQKWCDIWWIGSTVRHPSSSMNISSGNLGM